MLRSIMVVALATLLGSGQANADRRIESPADHAVITDGTVHRFLFKAEGLRNVSSIAVSRAHLTFDVGGNAADRSLYLRICPVTTNWDAGSANWTDGWSRPGGDFDEEMAALSTVDLSREGRKAIFDVTPIMKEWIEQGADYDGFILTVQRREGGEGIRGSDLSRLQGLQNASLEVSYRKVPPAPPRRNRG